MEKFKHRYIFYFFRKGEKKSFFRFFGRVRDGKALAVYLGRDFDYQKIF